MVSLLAESWTWWSLVLFVAISSISRRMTLGAFHRYQADDYGMLLVLAFYTTLIAVINIVRFTNSNLLPPGFDVNSLTAEEIKERSYGSKLILVVEQCQCTTIWGAKACLIILYLRLTTMHRENMAIKILAAYVAISFVIMEVLYFGVWCRPFWEYWAVPTNSIQCDAATNHLITNAVFNLTSDCILLAVGLPMFLRLHLPWRRKIPLILIFSLGIFVILAAVLNKVYSFTQPFGSAWTYWYVRESSTALLVANLPFVWTLWRRIPGLASASQHSKHNPSLHEQVQLQERMDNKDALGGRQPGLFPGETRAHSEAGSDLDPFRSQMGGALSLDELLRETEIFSDADPEANIITHPRLFTQKQRAGLILPTQKETSRDDEVSKAQVRGVPVESRQRSATGASTLPLIDSARSAGSPL